MISFLSADCAALRMLAPTRRDRRRRRSRGSAASGPRARAAAWCGSASSCGSGKASRSSSKADHRAVEAEIVDERRMHFAEPADDGLRAELQAAAAARMAPGRRFGDDLQLVDVVAEDVEQGGQIGLGVEHVDRCAAPRQRRAPRRRRAWPWHRCAARPGRRRGKPVRPRTGRGRRCRGSGCAAPRRAGPAAARAACRSGRRRWGWRA